MRVFVGVDLGSTTTKAVLLTESEQILGRGITNSRSNYDVACGLARSEAFTTARFELLGRAIAADPMFAGRTQSAVADLLRCFRREQHIRQIEMLEAVCRETAREGDESSRLDEIFSEMRTLADGFFAQGEDQSARSDFFRDIAASHYLKTAESLARTNGVRFDRLMSLFDRSILRVENSPPDLSFESNILAAVERALRESVSAGPSRLAAPEGGTRGPHGAPPSGGTRLQDGAPRPDEPSPGCPQSPRDQRSSCCEQSRTDPHSRCEHHAVSPTDRLRRIVDKVAAIPLEEAAAVGTGYGRARLPFPKEQIRSEILCHGLGSHAFFPGTATVLDIGGQDTKAIQVDADGIVTSFQMNDRCAAGCGRYLGYIADEMNLGLHELGPLAQRACRPTRIASTCTVFAGAELRERLSLGEKREDILAGLHRAIILRAMSLLARSGGVRDQFTFTGGVAKNPAALDALRKLVQENYGSRTLNVSPDSIYTGAVGAALFARRGQTEQDSAVTPDGAWAGRSVPPGLTRTDRSVPPDVAGATRSTSPEGAGGGLS